MHKHYFIYRVVCTINNITIHLPTFQEQLGMMFIATLQFLPLGLLGPKGYCRPLRAPPHILFWLLHQHGATD